MKANTSSKETVTIGSYIPVSSAFFSLLLLNLSTVTEARVSSTRDIRRTATTIAPDENRREPSYKTLNVTHVPSWWAVANEQTCNDRNCVAGLRIRVWTQRICDHCIIIWKRERS